MQNVTEGRLYVLSGSGAVELGKMKATSAYVDTSGTFINLKALSSCAPSASPFTLQPQFHVQSLTSAVLLLLI